MPTVYRFARYSNGAYFYTGNEDEVRSVLANYPDFRYEGPAFEADVSAERSPVYRFANLNTGGYFYTSNEVERATVLRDYPEFRFEGSTFAVAGKNAVNVEPIYRLANLINRAYLFTASLAERDAAVASGIWRNEGDVFEATKGPLADKTWSALSSFDAKGLWTVAGISVDDNGDAIVVSQGSTGQLTAFNGRRVKGPDGKSTLTWAPKFNLVLSTNGAERLVKPSESPHVEVGFSDSGNAAVVWRANATCSNNNRVQQFGCEGLAVNFYKKTRGMWEAPEFFDAPPRTSINQVAVNSRGDIVVASDGNLYWFDSTNPNLGYRRYSLAGLSSFYSSSGISKESSQLVLDDNGNVRWVCTCYFATDEKTGIWAVEGNIAGGFTPPLHC